jgi:4-amino-4-deoxy-L-arabinose transferase-like glycosyltransferase
MTAAPRTTPPRWRDLIGLLAIGLALRLVWWATYPLTIENEGAEYARLAENWFAGNGYVGLFGGPHVVFPPLYPGLIGLVRFLAGDVEVAARVVSLIAGLALVAALHGVTREAFGDQVGRLAALLGATHPLLIALSISTYSEGLAMAFVTGAAYVALRYMRTWTGWRALGAGGLIGLAYLTRPETLAFALALSLGLAVSHLVRRRQGMARALGSGSLVLVGAAVVAAPYVASLSLQAGSFRWEGKSAVVDLINSRIRAGMSFPEAARGLARDDGGQQGPFLSADQSIFLKYPPKPAAEVLTATVAAVPARLPHAFSALRNAEYLGVLALVCAVLGVLGHGWRKGPQTGSVLLLALGLLQGSFLLALEYPWPRYVFPLLPFVIPWAALGIDRVCALLVPLLQGRLTGARIQAAVAGTAVLMVAVNGVHAYPSVKHLGEFQQGRDPSLRQAGGWIRDDAARSRQDAAPPLVMGYESAVAFYAGAVLSYLPFAEEAAALRYVEQKAPDYIFARSSEYPQTPYVEDWLVRGIPHRCAVPAHDLSSASARPFRIWRWDCDRPEPFSVPPRVQGS